MVAYLLTIRERSSIMDWKLNSSECAKVLILNSCYKVLSLSLAVRKIHYFPWVETISISEGMKQMIREQLWQLVCFAFQTQISVYSYYTRSFTQSELSDECCIRLAIYIPSRSCGDWNWTVVKQFMRERSSRNEIQVYFFWHGSNKWLKSWVTIETLFYLQFKADREACSRRLGEFFSWWGLFRLAMVVDNNLASFLTLVHHLCLAHRQDNKHLLRVAACKRHTVNIINHWDTKQVSEKFCGIDRYVLKVRT